MGAAWLVLLAWIVFAMLEFGDGGLDKRMLYFAKSLAEAASGSVQSPAKLEQRLQATEKIFIDGFAEFKSTEGYQPVYQVFNKAGELIYQTLGSPMSPIAQEDGVFAQRDFLENTWRTVAATSSDGLVRVHIAERTDQRLAANWRMVRNIGFSQLIICLWCIIVIWVAAQRGFKPLKALAEQLSSRQLGDVKPVTVLHRYAETAPIVDELNALLARESARLETERNFLAEAAHELRTPLAAINAQAHAMLTANEVKDQQLAAKELQQGTERVSHLLTQLLSIAQAESRAAESYREQVDVAHLVREHLAVMAGLARASKIDLSLDAPSQLMCAVDPSGFISMLDNLVGNAITYTHAGGQVAVCLKACKKGSVQLQVSDDGPGIPVAVQARVFERFYRVPGTIRSGSGLGLSIVKRIAESHQAVITLREGLAGRGLGVLVSLPIRNVQ
jgi:signal transduction histidine kinase